MLLRITLIFLGALGCTPKLHAQSAPDSSASPVLLDSLGDPLPDGAIARLGTLRFKHNQDQNNFGREPSIDAALFSPDGSRIVSLKSNVGTMRLWDASTGKEINGPWRSSNFRYTAVAFSPDGTLLAAAIQAPFRPNNVKGRAVREAIVLFDITGPPKIKAKISGAAPPVQAIGFANQGKTLVTGGDGAIHWWDVATSIEDRSWEPLAGEETKVENGVKLIKTFSNCVLAPDAQSIAVQVEWRSADNQQFFQRNGNDSTLEAIGFDLDAQKTRWRTTGRGFQYERSQFAFSADGKRVAVALGSNKVELRDAGTGKLVLNPVENRASGYNGGTGGLALSSDGRTMALSSRDSNIHLYHDEDAGPPRSFVARIAQNGPASTACLRFSPDDQRLLVGVDADIQIYDVHSLTEVRQWEGHRGWIDQLAFTPDGNRLLTATSGPAMIRAFAVNGNVQYFDVGGRGGVEQAVWDVATWKQTRLTSTRTPPWPNLGSASLDQSVYVGKTGDDRFAFYDMKTGRLQARMMPDKEATVEVAFFAPGGKHFVQYVKNSKGEVAVRLYGAPSGKLISVLPPVVSGRNPFQMVFQGPLERANSIAFSHDAKLVALFGWGDGLIHVYDTSTGKLRHSLGTKAAVEGGVVVRGGNVDSVFSPDGKLIASWSSQERAIHLWDVATGAELVQIVPDATVANTRAAPRSQQRRFVLAWSPDGRTLSAGENTIRIFEIATLGVRRELTGHADCPIHALAFSPSGRILASASADTTVLVWDVAGTGPAPLAKTPDAGALEKGWRTLVEDDAARGFAAILDLAATPKETVAWIRERVKPEGVTDPKRIEKLIGDLGDTQFSVRQGATAELSRMGERVVPALDNALAGKPALETHLRLQSLRKQLANPVLKSDRLRAFRVIEVLERINTPDAREMLQTLADGAPGALLATQASRALARMDKSW
jgi:WD40 repeat protein